MKDITHHDTTSLAALVGSRICHDLISPIGAISNGLELIGLSGSGPAGPELELIQQSCDNASARVQFFRVAFGQTGDMRPVRAEQLQKTLSGYYAGTRITAAFSGTPDLPRAHAQIGCLAVLSAETALPQGGRIRVSASSDAIAVRFDGETLSREDTLWGIFDLVDPVLPPDLRPAHVQFGLLAILCRAFGALPRVTFQTKAAEMHIAVPKAPDSSPV